MVILYIFASVILVSLISIIAALPLLFKKEIPKKVLLALMSLSVGTLLAGVFIHFIPEIIETGYTTKSAIYIIAGFLSFFIIEKFIHYHHHKNCESKDFGHSHGYNLGPINIISDAMHNFLDGLIIAGSYMVNINLGIVATISVIFHEVPQEISDFGILLYSGYSKSKAIFYNLLSATFAIIGAIIAIILSGKAGEFTNLIIPFTAGNFIYIAASNLVPELHRHCKIWDTLLHLSAIITGVLIILILNIFI